MCNQQELPPLRSHPPLGVTQLAILARVRPEPKTVRQLAEALNLAEAGIRAKLRKLVGYGLIEHIGGDGSEARYASKEAPAEAPAPARRPRRTASGA